ncbi:ABC transporter permease [Solwaraspora sp. WMMD1047]|uniref:ABC transporter permease n=1 Tax=Solwaraspora sp. WMMD1047 TaxID=3016102 RepID=UPI00241713C6|nr:ABC transporter permease [Solwaraspora sp. WMMD1047]MDG4834249.1 ABC transporter permease [Solwaraspora sp. WMMD1047]
MTGSGPRPTAALAGDPVDAWKGDTVAPPGADQMPWARRAARSVLSRAGLGTAVVVVAVVSAWALFPETFAPGDPLDGVPGDRLQPPNATHWFGTDQLGRDLYTRMVHGASLSLRATLVAVGVALVLGGSVGLFAGFVGRWVDDAAMRLVDVLLAIPGLLLSLAVVTVLGFGTMNVAIAVGVATAANFARVMRAEVLRVNLAVFVEAARTSGVRWYGVLGRHVLPNAFGPVFVMATLELGNAILSVSALSFLGYGAAPPSPEWGSLIAQGRSYLASAPWLTTLPGLVVAALVLAVNRVARELDTRGRAAS